MCRPLGSNAHHAAHSQSIYRGQRNEVEARVNIYPALALGTSLLHLRTSAKPSDFKGNKISPE